MVDASEFESPVLEVQETMEIPAADFQPLITAFEGGISVVILGLGLVGGLIFSKIVNWWKW